MSIIQEKSKIRTDDIKYLEFAILKHCYLSSRKRISGYEFSPGMLLF